MTAVHVQLDYRETPDLNSVSDRKKKNFILQVGTSDEVWLIHFFQQTHLWVLRGSLTGDEDRIYEADSLFGQRLLESAGTDPLTAIVESEVLVQAITDRVNSALATWDEKSVGSMSWVHELSE